MTEMEISFKYQSMTKFSNSQTYDKYFQKFQVVCHVTSPKRMIGTI